MPCVRLYKIKQEKCQQMNNCSRFRSKSSLDQIQFFSKLIDRMKPKNKQKKLIENNKQLNNKKKQLLYRIDNKNCKKKKLIKKKLLKKELIEKKELSFLCRFRRNRMREEKQKSNNNKRSKRGRNIQR